MRMLWMAVAASLAASPAIVVGKPRSRKPTVLLARSVAALATSTLLAAWSAVQLGATAAPGIFAVSFVLGLFFHDNLWTGALGSAKWTEIEQLGLWMTRD